MRIGLYISAGATTPIDAILARFERAEADGFAYRVGRTHFDHDALTLLALAARATRRLELGSWVVPAPSGTRPCWRSRRSRRRRRAAAGSCSAWG